MKKSLSWIRSHRKPKVIVSTSRYDFFEVTGGLDVPISFGVDLAKLSEMLADKLASGIGKNDSRSFEIINADTNMVLNRITIS